MSENKHGLTEALALLDRHLTVRAKRLATLERFVEGTQYDHLPNWFSDKVPLWERAPCIVYPIVKIAIDSNANLLLGEGRFPEFRFDGLEGEEAEAAEDALDKLVQQSRLKAASREEFEAGQAVGSGCSIYSYRAGRLFIDTVSAKSCVPTLDEEGAVLELEIKYPFLALEKVETEEKWVCKLYRRIVNKTQDIIFKPAKAREDGKEPTWVVDSEIAHGFGFCPVVWYAHMRGCAVHNEYDGKAIHQHLTDEIRAHDFALSQRHRAAMYAGDPQWTEIGVEPGYNPTSKGRVAHLPNAFSPRPGTSQQSAWESEATSFNGAARQKTPGGVWQYNGKNPEVKVQMHTLPGDALTALDNNAKDLRKKLSESLGVVFLDIESLPNESRMSGRAFESVKAQQLDRIDYYRSDFGDKFLRPALGMLLRIALVKEMKVKGLDIVQRQITAAGESWSWHSPPVDFVWGDYFKPSGEEELALMQGAKFAKDAGIATTRILVEKLRSVLGIRDVDAYMQELEKEKEEAKAEQKEMLDAEAKATAAARPKPAAIGAK